MPVLLGLKFDSILLVKGLSVLPADFITLIYGKYGTPFLFANINGLKQQHTGVVCDLSIIISEHERRWKGRSCRLIFFATNK